MAHKEWESDEFLNEFLEFDYRKPVPDHREENSKRSPAERTSRPEQEQKSYGLNDEYKLYEDLRKDKDLNAGTKPSAPAETDSLRSSGAFHPEIPAPLSARNKGFDPYRAETRQPAAPAADAAPVRSAKPEAVAAPVRPAKPEAAAPPIRPAKPEAAAPTARPAKPEAAAPVELDEHKPKSRKKFGFGKLHASELAAEALGAAKKLVSTDEDKAPEAVPPAADISEISGIGGGAAQGVSHDFAPPIKARESKAAPAEEKDELAELFAELGESSGDSVLSSEENEALEQAQQNAYDRYRGNYLKGIRKKEAAARVGMFPKWLSRIYLLALVVFAAVITIMNVLPFGMLIAFYVILGLLSLIIIMQLRRPRVRRGTRVFASIAAIFLIACFGLGTAYSMGTLSFLDDTSVENEDRVASITRDPFNVCITGIDVNGKIDEQGRSDVNMVLTVNPKTEQILMTSIPRDYQIYMPDKDNAMDKLTHTGFYSVETTIGAEEQLLDTKINYYVKVNFTTVKEFIDAVGGIDVYSEYEFTPVKMKDWTVQKGWNHMNGKQALAFARERKAFVDGDNQRIKNQQAVFEALIKKAVSSKTMVLSYNKILTNLRDYFRMSFSSGELRSLIKLQLAKNPDWKIYRNTIRGGDGSLPTYSTGNAYAYVMTQDEDSINNAKSLINAVLEGRLLDKDDDGNAVVVPEEGDGESEGTDPEGE